MLATVLARVVEHKKSKNAKHCRIAYDGGRPAEQRDVRCVATTYIFFITNEIEMIFNGIFVMPLATALPNSSLHASLCVQAHPLR